MPTDRIRAIIFSGALLVCMGRTLVWAQPAASAAKFEQTHFGILYDTMHCLLTTRTRTPHDISKAIAGTQPWGPIPEFHYWTEPRLGYYCLDPNLDAAKRQDTNVDAVLKQHAQQIHDAGIDFIVMGSSNNDIADDERSKSKISIQEPFTELLKVWSTIPDAPKVVVWAPLTRDGTMLEWLLTQLATYPQLQFMFQGKPLALVAENRRYNIDLEKYQELSRNYTLRRMWGLVRGGGDEWSFMNLCADDQTFRTSQGTTPCNQRVAELGGRVEQIAVAPAFQENYMSNTETSVPRFHGRTFTAQFATAFAHPEAPIVTIDTWNEWMAQRFCLDANGHAAHGAICATSVDHFPNGNKVFVDTYDAEYSRDMEPTKAAVPGDFYYKLMADCIKKFRQGLLCHANDIPYP